MLTRDSCRAECPRPHLLQCRGVQPATIDRVRYLLGVFHLLLLPMGLTYCLVIHGFAHRWRKIGPLRTYLIVVLPVVCGIAALIFPRRRLLLGASLGTSWALVAIAAVLYSVTTWLELQYWKHLSFGTLVGLPELSPRRTGRLLRDGIYSVVRHPRYLSAGIAVLANALLINYTGIYFLLLLILPPGYAMLMLEERDLANRFGEEYRAYQRDVPSLVPRWRKTTRNPPAR